MNTTLHPELLKEAFMYFARFPLLEGVMDSMFRSGKNAVTGYIELREDVRELAPNSLIPEIGNYLFSSNEDKLKKDIEDTKGIFMLLDYGQLACTNDKLNRQNDTFELGIIVARKLKPDDYDMAEILLMQDHILNIIRDIRKQMKKDHQCPFIKMLQLPQRIDPWYARDLHNATGFSMMFTKSGVDMI